MKTLFQAVLTVAIIFLFSIEFLIAQTQPKYLSGTFSRFWNPGSSSWELQDSMSYSYYPDGKLKQETRFFGDEPYTGQMEPSNRAIKYYNADGTIKEAILFYYNSFSWDTGAKDIYAYSTSNNTILSQSYTDGIYKNSTLQTTNLDKKGNKLSEMVQGWDDVKSAWESNGDYKTEYTYDSSNFMLTNTRLSYSATKSAYVNMWKYNYTNNTMGMPTASLYQVWDGVSKFYDIEKDSTIYDSNGKKINNYHRYRHAGGMDKWGMSYKETFTYSATGKLSTFLTEVWDTSSKSFLNIGGSLTTSIYNSDSSVVKITSEAWDTLASNWGHSAEIYLYYMNSPLSTNDSKVAEVGFIAYPNPFSNCINIDTKGFIGSEITLYDLRGRLVLKDSMNGVTKTTLNTYQLKAGIYLLKLSTRTGDHIQKIIKSE